MRDRLIATLSEEATWHIDVLGKVDRNGASRLVDELLKVLRAPNDAMTAAGRRASLAGQSVEAVFVAMIDQAGAEDV